MNCHDIQQKLSAYAEGIISPEEKMLIEEHLKICPQCNESLMDLRKTIDYVHNLEDVEPPPWFTLRVMAKIKAEAKPKKGILQKLFYPFHIKLPIEAVAATLVAVLTIYIFKTMQPEMKLAQAPSEHKTVIAKSPSKAGEATSEEKIASPLTRSDGKKLLPSFPLLEKTTPSSPPLEKGGKGGFEAEYSVPLKKPAPMDKLEEAPQAPPPIQEQDEISRSVDAVAKDEFKTEILSSAAKAKVSDEKKEVFKVTVLVKDIKSAETEIETALTQFGGNVILTASLENKEIVTAEIDSQKLKEFIANLKSIGDVKGKEIDFQALEGNIKISIAIMKQP
jgi:hypothetical protein